MTSLKHDIDFTILTIAHQENLPAYEVYDDIPVYRKPYLFSLSRSKYSVQIIIALLMMAKNYDTILLNSPSSNIFPFAIIAKLFGKKLLIYHQADIVLPRGILNKTIDGIFFVSTFLAFGLANKVSTFTKDYALHSPLLRPFMHKFTPLIPPILFRKAEAVKSDKIDTIKKLRKNYTVLLGFAGRFVEEKGFDILFQAIPLLIKKYPSLHFVFAGETQVTYENFFYKNEDLFNKVKKYITFLGLLNDQELKTFYTSIDFIVVPSRKECFNLVQAEAMVLGTPTIISDIPGGRYLVKHSQFGRLFKSEDPVDLAEKIIDGLTHETQIKTHHKDLLKLLNNTEHINAFKQFILS